jgi:hypothetical protein
MSSSILSFFGKRANPFAEVFAGRSAAVPVEAIYAAMIAGQFPLAKGAQYQSSAYWMAREALNTEDVAQLCAKDSKNVYYLAIPTAVTKNTGRFETALAAALPGHPQHVGDAAYTLRFPAQNFAVAILKTEEDFRIIANEVNPVFEAIEESGLKVVDCSEVKPDPLVSMKLAAQESAYRLNNVLSLSFAGLFIIFSLLLLFFKVGAGLTGSVLAAQLEAKEKQLQEVSQTLNLISPLSRDLAQLSRISATVSRAGGWIKYYNIDDKGQESFELELPSWVSRDYIEALGPGVKIDRDRVRELLIVVKNMPADKKVK